MVLNLVGRRIAPFAGNCAFAGDSIEVTIIDLQGRKSIDRRNCAARRRGASLSHP